VGLRSEVGHPHLEGKGGAEGIGGDLGADEGGGGDDLRVGGAPFEGAGHQLGGHGLDVGAHGEVAEEDRVCVG